MRWLLLLALAGCTPVAWRGASPDGKHRASVVERGRAQELIVDGRAVARWDAISEILIDDDGTPLYAAQRGKRWTVVVDGRETGWFDAVMKGSVVRRGPHVAYAATVGGRQVVVRDGVAGPSWDAVGMLRFDANGRRLAHSARSGREAWLVLDDKRYGPYQALAEIALDEGSRAGWVARRAHRWFAVVDGEEQPPADSVAGIGFSPSGARAAWVERRDHHERLLADGTPGPEFERVDARSLLVGDDHVFYRATREGHWFVVADGTESEAWSRVDAPVRAGAHWGYIGHRGGRSFVVLDGKSAREEAWAGDLALDASGRAAWVARRDGGLAVVSAGEVSRFDVVIAGTLMWGPDGRWGGVAGDRATRRLYIVVGGERRTPIDLEEVTDSLGRADELEVAAATTALLRRWVVAALLPPR